MRHPRGGSGAGPDRWPCCSRSRPDRFPRAPTFPSASGLNSGLRRSIPGPEWPLRLCLVLKDPRYRDVFGTLGEDVAGVVAGAATGGAGHEAAARTPPYLGALHQQVRARSVCRTSSRSAFSPNSISCGTRSFSCHAAPAAVRCLARSLSWRRKTSGSGRSRSRSRPGVSEPRTPFRSSNLDQLDRGAALDALILYHVTIESMRRPATPS